MGLFQLDPENLVRRTHTEGDTPRVPTLAGSVLRGTIGFTVVSVIGFSPWALWGGYFYRMIGSAGLYALCALVFVIAAGPFLHRLIMGPGTLSRFYKLFTPAFVLYAAGWMFLYFKIGGHSGGLYGLLAGCALMIAVMAFAFEATLSNAALSFIAFFGLNAVGYFSGGWFDEYPKAFEAFRSTLGLDANTAITVAKALWGVFYGLGFGAGLGLAFYFCQSKARAKLNDIMHPSRVH